MSAYVDDPAVQVYGLYGFVSALSRALTSKVYSLKASS